jgi:hypothetical protein
MKIVFKVIAIIGILSFLGGLKNGVFFIFGLILAGIFGYFGWRPEKKLGKEQSSSPTERPKKATTTFRNVNSSNKYSTIKQVIKSDNELSESELEKQIETLNQKKELLIRSYNEGLFNSKEYDQKKSELELEISKLNQLLTLKLTTEKVLLENKNLFDRLLELKARELITSEEYKFKYNELLSSLLQKIEVKNEEVENDRHQEFNDSDSLIHQEIVWNRTKSYYLLVFSLLLIVTVSIIIFQYSSNTSIPHSSYIITNEQVGNSDAREQKTNENLIQKDTVKSNKIDNNKSNKVNKSDYDTPLDRIYIGTNLFHQGNEGTWGSASISKQGDHYWIKGEHKMSDGDWVKIEGSITNPSIDGFTFKGKISSYSPSRAKSNEKYGKWEEKDGKLIHITNIDYPDTCVWIGKTEAYKLFKDRKYWRINSHDCYSYTTDIDIFHN